LLNPPDTGVEELIVEAIAVSIEDAPWLAA
jgi:hypothetical protein